MKTLFDLYGFFSHEQKSEKELSKQLTAISNDENYRILEYVDGGDVVASIMVVIIHNLVGRGRDFMIIENVIVDPAHRRKGHIRRLFLEAELWAKERDCFKIIVISNKKYETAKKAYEAMGFESESSNVFIKHL